MIGSYLVIIFYQRLGKEKPERPVSNPGFKNYVATLR